MYCHLTIFTRVCVCCVYVCVCWGQRSTYGIFLNKLSLLFSETESLTEHRTWRFGYTDWLGSPWGPPVSTSTAEITNSCQGSRLLYIALGRRVLNTAPSDCRESTLSRSHLPSLLPPSLHTPPPQPTWTLSRLCAYFQCHSIPPLLLKLSLPGTLGRGGRQ